MAKGKCAVCKEEAHQQCAGCKTVYYCSKDHQKAHWKLRHKQECCCYKIVENGLLGRHLTAARNINVGEVILKEPPLVIGPKVACPPTCLGCHKKLEPTSPDEDTPLNYYKCSGCSWPLCAPRCEKTSYHRSECELMKKNGFSSTINYDVSSQMESAYCIILPLRCLLLESSKLQRLLELQSHLETRIKTPVYQILKRNLVGFIRAVLKLDQFDEETVMRVAAILDTNSFEIRRTLGNIKIRGLYPKAAMMSHDCKPNTKHTYDGDDFNIIVSATVDIKKDEIISTTYTQTLWGTQARQKHLKDSKCFLCNCRRCSDPTEFGLYVSGILCSKCKGNVISNDPFNDNSRWECENCSHIISARQIMAGNDSLRRELENNRPLGITRLEKFLEKYLCKGSVLHPTNSHILQAKHALSQLYSNSSQSLSTKQLQQHIIICEELLRIADVLEPGPTRFRGLLLYDLQAAKLLQTKHKYENEMITEEESQVSISNITKILGEAAEILKTEPDLVYLLQDKIKELSELCQ